MLRCKTLAMRPLSSAGVGFLLAVLWFDLMFDSQVRRGHGPILPEEIRDSIARYYRRVTTTARPMNLLVASVMIVTIAALIAEVLTGDAYRWAAGGSLALTGASVGLAATRTVRAAVRLGTQTDSAQVQTILARTIYRDHLICITAIAATLAIQLIA